MNTHKGRFGLATPPLAVLMLALGACAATPPAKEAQPAPGEPQGSCDASKAQFAVGQEPGLAIQDQARTRAGARLIRTVRPGQAITMEYNAERLTLNLDASGRVMRVTCG